MTACSRDLQIAVFPRIGSSFGVARSRNDRDLEIAAY